MDFLFGIISLVLLLQSFPALLLWLVAAFVIYVLIGSEVGS